jgi:hypothetical protein
MTGAFTGSIDFDPSRARFPLSSINSPFEIRDGNERGGDRFASYDGFITILTAGGGFVHADTFGGTDDDFGMGLAPRATPASSGELPNTFVLAGRFGGTASFPRAGGDVARTASGRADAFVSFFDTLGVFADDE